MILQTEIGLAFYPKQDNLPPDKYKWRQVVFRVMKTNPIDIFKKSGGQLRMSDATKHGISRYMLYSLLDRGVIERISRGTYRLTDLPPVSNPDLTTVSLRYPNSVICLISALSFHQITTQIPHEISIAVSRNSRPPSLDYPPLHVHRFSDQAYHAGIEEHQIDGIPVKVYSPEKTLADSFKFRKQIGMDVVLEALKLYKVRMKFDHQKILEYARLCRVDKIIFPYLEANI
jgi:predicted transcriptional regulator of viral defense system